jgi:hypothetical protein
VGSCSLLLLLHETRPDASRGRVGRVAGLGAGSGVARWPRRGGASMRVGIRRGAERRKEMAEDGRWPDGCESVDPRGESTGAQAGGVCRIVRYTFLRSVY